MDNQSTSIPLAVALWKWKEELLPSGKSTKAQFPSIAGPWNRESVNSPVGEITKAHFP